MFDVLHGGRHDELRAAAGRGDVPLPDPGAGADPFVGYFKAVRQVGAGHRARGTAEPILTIAAPKTALLEVDVVGATPSDLLDHPSPERRNAISLPHA